jgi:hypothetical protein
MQEGCRGAKIWPRDVFKWAMNVPQMCLLLYEKYFVIYITYLHDAFLKCACHT